MDFKLGFWLWLRLIFTWICPDLKLTGSICASNFDDDDSDWDVCLELFYCDFFSIFSSLSVFWTTNLYGDYIATNL
jgi:hypothetical protein